MADFDFTKNTDDDRVLVIGFNNRRPISAAQLASVLAALDRDYRDMTGGGLILGRMELGSSWIWLVDAAVYAGIAGIAAVVSHSTLGTFAAGLRDGFTSRVNPYTPLVEEADVDRSIAAIGKLSEDTDADIMIRKPADPRFGERPIEAMVSREEAVRAKNKVKKKRKKKREAGVPLLDQEVPARLIESIRRLPPISAEIEAIIRVIVQAHLQTGSIYVLEQVAHALEYEGRTDAARIIREMIRKGHGEVETGF